MRALTPPVATALLSIALLAGCSQATSAPGPAQQTYRATAVGRIDARDEARQLVAAADGVIAGIFTRRGDLVTRGQRLLDVDCAPRIEAIRARAADAVQASASAETIASGARVEERTAAAAQLSAANSAARDATDALTRVAALEAQGFVTRREIEFRRNAAAVASATAAAAQARADQMRNGPRASEVTSARARSMAAQAETQVARATADQCSLRSPINGTVLQVLRREGEFSGAAQGAPLIIVGDLSQLIVRAEINEHDAAAVHQGQRADIWIEGRPDRWHGHVVELAQVMGRRSARSLNPTDRFDRDIREALIEFDGSVPPALVGLRVMVGVRP